MCTFTLYGIKSIRYEHISSMGSTYMPWYTPCAPKPLRFSGGNVAVVFIIALIGVSSIGSLVASLFKGYSLSLSWGRRGGGTVMRHWFHLVWGGGGGVKEKFPS